MACMKYKIILCMTLILSGGLVGQSVALANLGETFAQINARYGQPLKRLPDSMIHDRAINIYRYEFNGRRIFIEFMDGKSVSETVRAPQTAPNFSDKTCLAMAVLISGKTNWTELSRNEEGAVWVASDTTATLQRNSNTPDYFFVSSMKYDAHEMQLDQRAASPLIGTNKTKVEIKAADQSNTNTDERKPGETHSPPRSIEGQTLKSHL